MRQSKNGKLKQKKKEEEKNMLDPTCDIVGGVAGADLGL
jgi:hypothetical protein